MDGGFLFYGSAGYEAVDLQNEQVAIAYSRWPVDVINLGFDDSPYARTLLAREGLEERARTLPMIRNMISANLTLGPDAATVPGYTIKAVSGPRIYGGKRKIKIGFVGLAAAPRSAVEANDRAIAKLVQAGTPSVIKARRECDVLVIVAHCELEPALKIAAQNLDADVVIAADAGGVFKPRQVGNTLVVSAAPGNTQEGDLRLYIDKEGRVTYKFRATDLDSFVPSDAAAAAFVERARAERAR